MSYYDKIDLKKDLKKNPKKELLKNLTEFNKDKKQWLESPNKSKYFNAKYFIHAKIGSEDMFAFSKFCAHKNMTVEKYIEAARRNTPNGEKADKKKLYGRNKTRERIQKIMGITKKDWIPFERLPPKEQESFSSWIGYFFPDNSHFG